MPRPARSCGRLPDTRGRSTERCSAPTVGISSPLRRTRRRGSGMPRPASRCGRSPDTRAAVNRAAFSADGRHIVTASRDKTARIWDAETGQEVRALTGHQGCGRERGVQRRRSAYRHGLVGQDGADLGRRDRPAGAGAHRAHRGRSTARRSAPTVGASSRPRDKTARIWDAETGQEVWALTGHHDAVYSAAFSADGRRIVTASA